MDQLKDLIAISQKFGKNEQYILAGGGNTSFKDSERLWIKASGSSLAEINANGFVCLAREKLKVISTRQYSNESQEREAQVKDDLHAAILYPKNKRPSVETSLHNAIEYPFIVHTHPTLINALLCSKNAKELSKQLFGNNILFVEYTDPGYVLFKRVENDIKKYRSRTGQEPQIIFLQNHGVFVGANTIEEIDSIYQHLTTRIMEELKEPLPDARLTEVTNSDPIRELLVSEFNCAEEGIVMINNELIEHYTTGKQAFNKVAKPLTPDDIVYCKSNFLFAPNDTTQIKNSINQFTAQFSYFPKVIAIENKGIAFVDSTQKSAKTVAKVFLNMLKVCFLACNFGGPQTLNQQQIDFIDNWEVENYRRKVSQKN